MQKLLFVSGLTVVVLIVSACIPTRSLLSVTDSGLLQANGSLTYDWGDIDIGGGTVEHVFSFTNSDSTQLVLRGARTSCMCTTAHYELPDGTVSPLFGMHTEESNWAYAVQPGESFSVNVVFDPMAHGPNGTGPISRTVNLDTSARAGSADIELRVKAHVLPSPDVAAK